MKDIIYAFMNACTHCIRNTNSSTLNYDMKTTSVMSIFCNYFHDITSNIERALAWGFLPYC